MATADRLLALLRAGGDARTDKVRRLRRSVRTGAYENDLKLSIAVDRVVRELGHDAVSRAPRRVSRPAR